QLRDLSRRRRAVLIRCAIAVAFALIVAPRLAHPHPFAVSHVEVRTDGDALRVSFELDATSVGDLIERYAGAPGRDVRAHRDTLLSYLDARFTVAADGQPCAREPAAQISESGGRV